MKTIFVFALVLCVFTINAQTVDCVKEINFENQGSILFPEVKNIEGSEEINKYLVDYLKNAFYIKKDKSLLFSLEEAEFKGLDSLTYLAFETDSTLSVALTFTLKRVDMLSGWVEFFTFNKKSGKRMQLFELFPSIDICKVSNTMISLIHKQIRELNFNVYKLYEDKRISKEEYSYADFIINKVLLGSISNKYNFMLWKNHLYLKNGILFPQNINSSIPVFFIIDVNEFKFRAEMYNCFKSGNSANE